MYEKFVQQINYDGQRYEVSLPWKEHHPPLPDHYDLCCKRLTNLLKRLRQTPSLLTDYNTVIKDQMRGRYPTIAGCQWTSSLSPTSWSFPTGQGYLETPDSLRRFGKIPWGFSQQLSLHRTKVWPVDFRHSSAFPCPTSCPYWRHREGIPHGVGERRGS